MHLTGTESVFAVVAVVAVVLACGVIAENQRWRREQAARAYDRARRTCPQPPWTQADADRDAWAIAEQTMNYNHELRDKPHDTLAWGPGADQPVPYVPATPPQSLADADWALWEADMQTGSGL